MTPVEIGQAVAIVIVAVVVALDKLKERKAKKKGLGGNPERCEKHAIRLAVIEERLDHIETDIARLLEP